jgi:queuine tRNA-ribosyltransferase
LLFAIIQGGPHFDLRKKCAEELIAMGFDGYALGGLAVGESPEEMLAIVREVAPLLPKEKPRYLMGVGDLAQMEAAIAMGIDMFDCVLPMRLARHGRLLLSDDTTLNIHLAAFKNDHTPIDPGSPSVLSRTHTKSYLRHLLASQERYGETIATMQNVGVTLHHLRRIREKMKTAETD